MFGTQLSTTVIPEIKAGSVPATIAKTALPSSGNIRNLALKLLRSKSETEFDIGKTLAQVRPNRHISNQSHLRRYAQLYWCSHLLKFKGLSRRLKPVTNQSSGSETAISDFRKCKIFSELHSTLWICGFQTRSRNLDKQRPLETDL